MGKISATKEFISTFGPRIFFIKSLRRMSLSSNSKLSWLINKINEDTIEGFLQNNVVENYEDYIKTISFPCSNVGKNPVWIFWYQGHEEAPALVKACINSVKARLDDSVVYLITKDNVEQYVKLPEFILNKVHAGIISKTHFSDVLRLALLYGYGGLWIDATVFVSKKISANELLKLPIFSIKTGNRTKDPSHGRWTTFLIGGTKDNKLFKNVLNWHLIYWSKYNSIIDYVIFDYFIKIAIDRDEECREQLEQIPINNTNVFELRKRLDLQYHTKQDLIIGEDTFFNKLSWKQPFQSEKNGSKTLYQKIIDEYA